MFATNNLDGSEDYLVSEKLFRLIGPDIQNYREKLMKEKSPNNLNDLLMKITPPKGGLISDCFSL